ncbi:elongation factor 1-beta-like isoform X2 [Physella acuta]|uniref:elongation factor 1-beta-like isoform X2 n=1 Tax=Physella acuta TaxID=109671 RepID=UPI0027DAD2B9|nr:elongation factor 1-beta-like isoform X2 [Physella acuta]
MANPLALENVWLQQQKFEDAERLYRQLEAGTTKASVVEAGGAGGDASVLKRLEALEKENRELRKITDDLKALILNIQSSGSGKPAATPAAAPAGKPPGKPAPSKPAPPADDDDDDDDLFGSDDEETKALKAKRLQDYEEKKAKKPVLIAKSSVLLDCKPWDDETDMAEMEKRVRSIELDGLVWGASKLVEVGYGIKKLTIMCVVEDDKVSIEDLSERITNENEDLVQSVDVAAFNKI